MSITVVAALLCADTLLQHVLPYVINGTAALSASIAQDTVSAQVTWHAVEPQPHGSFTNDSVEQSCMQLLAVLAEALFRQRPSILAKFGQLFWSQFVQMYQAAFLQQVQGSAAAVLQARQAAAQQMEHQAVVTGLAQPGERELVLLLLVQPLVCRPILVVTSLSELCVEVDHGVQSCLHAQAVAAEYLRHVLINQPQDTAFHPSCHWRYANVSLLLPFTGSDLARCLSRAIQESYHVVQEEFLAAARELLLADAPHAEPVTVGEPIPLDMAFYQRYKQDKVKVTTLQATGGLHELLHCAVHSVMSLCAQVQFKKAKDLPDGTGCCAVVQHADCAFSGR